MDRRAVRPGGVAIGALLVAVFGLVGIASGALSFTSDRVTVSPDQKGKATAECPRGSEAVAGGFASPGFDPKFNNAAIIHYDSHRTDDREWSTQAHNYARPANQMKAEGDGELDAYAVCDSKSPPIVIRTATKSVSKPELMAHSGPKGVGTAVAECPVGSEAVSGGFSSPGNRERGEAATYPFTSKRVGTRKWKVRAVNNDFTARKTLKAFAYCDKSEPGLYVKSDQVRVPGADKKTLDIGCRNGDKPLSGGYSSTFDAASNSAAFAFTSRPISGDRWRVSAFGSGATAKRADPKVTAGTLTAYAYCKG